MHIINKEKGFLQLDYIVNPISSEPTLLVSVTSGENDCRFCVISNDTYGYEFIKRYHFAPAYLINRAEFFKMTDHVKKLISDVIGSTHYSYIIYREIF